MGIWSRIRATFGFGELPAPIGDAGNWATGDMAECIYVGPWFDRDGELFAGPERGFVGVVRAISLGRDPRGAYCVYLAFSRWPGLAFDARGFRKLTPHADAATAADASFVDQLKKHSTPSTTALPIAARLKRILS